MMVREVGVGTIITTITIVVEEVEVMEIVTITISTIIVVAEGVEEGVMGITTVVGEEEEGMTVMLVGEEVGATGDGGIARMAPETKRY